MSTSSRARAATVVLAVFAALPSLAAPQGSGSPAAAKPPAAAAPAAAPASGQAPKADPARPVTTIGLTLPAFDEAFGAVPVARVASETITLRELMDTVAAAHEGRSKAEASKNDFHAILDRLIDVRLLVLEARAAGLDETPEFQKALADFKKVTLRTTVEAQVMKEAKPDPAEVEELFKASVREWKIRSLLFEKEDGAKELLAAVKAGQPFEDAVAKAVADKKAKGSGQVGDFVPESKFQGAVKEAVASMKVGDISPPLRLAEGYAVLRLEEVRYPENEAARMAAEQSSRNRMAAVALRDFHLAIRKKYVKKFDQKLVDRIDFEAKRPGFKALLKDKRVIVQVEGEPVITVADLTKEVESKFFHGVDEAIKEKRLNSKKVPALEFMIYRALFDHEARIRHVEDSLAFKRTVEDWEISQLWAAYLEKAIAPSVSLKDEDLKAYYEANKKEFSTAAFYSIDGIGFATADKAQAALNQLKGGTDFKWLKLNADGQVAADKRDRDLEGRTIIESSMPPELKKALEGVTLGDYRLYASPTGAFYVLLVSGHVPSKVRPYEEMREVIRKRVFNTGVDKAVSEWTAKLRQGYQVEVFITRLGA